MAAGVPPGLGPPGDGGESGEEEQRYGKRKTPQQVAAEMRLKHTQAQVQEVVGIMHTNVEKVLERDSKLSELEERADAIEEGASMFEKQAGALKRKAWLKNMKMMIIMGIIGFITLLFIGWKFELF